MSDILLLMKERPQVEVSLVADKDIVTFRELMKPLWVAGNSTISCAILLADLVSKERATGTI